jgi:hypothetical protein
MLNRLISIRLFLFLGMKLLHHLIRILPNSAKYQMIFLTVFSYFLFSSYQSNAQEIKVEVCENCFQEAFKETFEASKRALPPTHKDSARFTLKFNLEMEHSALLYLGDADYISVSLGRDTLLAGRFRSKNYLEKPFARYLIPLKLNKGENVLHVFMKQVDHKPFTVKPHLFLGSQIEEAIPLYYAQNENARIVNILSMVLLSLLLLYSFSQWVILKNRIFLFYGLYLFSVLFFLLVFSDEYLQWHLLLPERLHQYGAFNIIPQGLIYVVYCEFGIAFLDIKRWIQVINATPAELFNFSAKTSLGVLNPNLFLGRLFKI